MKVHCYHEDIGLPDQLEQIEAWKASWVRSGWEPVILSREDAKRHPLFFEYWNRIRTYPTTNSREYENTCWLRWLAYSVAARKHGIVLGVDYDMMNNGYQPNSVPVPLGDSRLIALHNVETSCAVGDLMAFESVIRLTLREPERGITRLRGGMHLSDMTLAAACPAVWHWEIVAQEWFPGCAAPLIHVSTESAGAHASNKLRIMQEIAGTLN